MGCPRSDVAAAEVEVVVIEEREHVLGKVGRLDGDREEGSGLGHTPVPGPAQPDESWNLRRVLLVGRAKMLPAPRLFRERHENEPATDQQRCDERDSGVAYDGVAQHRRDSTDVLRIARVPIGSGRNEITSQSLRCMRAERQIPPEREEAAGHEQSTYEKARPVVKGEAVPVDDAKDNDSKQAGEAHDSVVEVLP